MGGPCFSMVRGHVARFTRVLPNGRFGGPESGQVQEITTKGIISVRLTPKTSEVGRVIHRNDAGRSRGIWHEKVDDLGFSVDVTLTGVNPELIEMLTGSPLVPNANGVYVGNDMVPHIRPRSFRLEVWTRLADNTVEGCVNREYGYTLLPRLRGGRVRGITIANGLATIEIVGASTVALTPETWAPLLGPYLDGWDALRWDTFGWDSAPEDAWEPVPITKRTHLRVGRVQTAPWPDACQVDTGSQT